MSNTTPLPEQQTATTDEQADTAASVALAALIGSQADDEGNGPLVPMANGGYAFISRVGEPVWCLDRTGDGDIVDSTLDPTAPAETVAAWIATV